MGVQINGSTGITTPAVTASGAVTAGSVSGTTVDGTTLTEGTVAVPRMVLSTAQATTSGTAIDFTGIPSWVKRVTVMFESQSTNGSSPTIIQLGSGSMQTSGYVGFAMNGVTSGVNTSLGILTTASIGASSVRTGHMTLTHMGSNKWVASGVTEDAVAANGSIFSCVVTLSGTLDRLRLTTINGTDTFDAGSVNIMYEG